MFYRTATDMLAFLDHPLAMAGSDGSAFPFDHGGDRPHPRHFGTFPRILGRYVREDGQVSIEEAVHKMTGAVAERVGMTDRLGRVLRRSRA